MGKLTNHYDAMSALDHQIDDITNSQETPPHLYQTQHRRLLHSQRPQAVPQPRT